MRRIATVMMVFVMALGLVSFAAAQDKIDVTGTWLFSVTTEAGTGTPTVTLKQDGEKLTGHYSSATLGEADLTGTLKGKDLMITFKVDAQGTALEVTYKGTVEGPDALKGTVDLGGLGQGTFTAKKK